MSACVVGMCNLELNHIELFEANAPEPFCRSSKPAGVVAGIHVNGNIDINIALSALGRSPPLSETRHTHCIEQFELERHGVASGRM